MPGFLSGSPDVNQQGKRRNGVLKAVKINMESFSLLRRDFFDNSPSDPCEVKPHCSFDLHYSDDE